MNYKLIAMDFDGTLLNDDKNVSKVTKERLKLYKDLGYLIVGVTARILNSAKKSVPLDIFNYIILNNGASIYNVDTNSMNYIGYIAFDEIQKITKEFEQLCTQIDYITENTYYTYIKKQNSNYDFIKDINDLDEIDEQIVRMNMFFKDRDNINTYYELIKSKYKNVNCFIMQDSGSDNKWLVLNPKNVNKASTLEKLGNIENIKLDEMIYFGDGLNDLEVMKKVGLSVAMGNALDEVKKQATCITKTNNEDGIVKFLDMKLNKEKI